MVTIEFTTIKVARGDALLLRQLQTMLEMHAKSFNQSDLMHEMLGFMVEHDKEFVDNISQMQRRQRDSQELMKKLLRSMQSI